MKLPKIQWKNTERNRTIALAVFMIIALSAISLWQRNVPAPKKVTFQSEREMVAAVAQSDLQANDQIMKDIVNQKDLANDLAKQFGVTDTINLASIPDSKIKIQENSPENVQAYTDNVLSLVRDYNSRVAQVNTKMGDGTATADDYDTGYAAAKDVVTGLYSLSVPKDAVTYQREAINMFLANEDIFVKSKSVTDDSVWKYTYKNYAIVELMSNSMSTEYQKLKQTYNLK